MVAEIEREIELADYIEVFLKRKWLILLATLAGLAGGWWMTEAPSAALYQAKVLLMIKSSAQGGQEDLTASEVSVRPRALDFYKSLALADDLRQDLVDSLGLKRSLASLDGVMSAEIVGENALELAVRSPDPEFPVGLVNLWAMFFLDRNRGLTVEDLGNRYEWVVRQYEIARQNLERGEDALNAFEAGNSIANLELQQSLFDSTHRSLKAELHALRFQLQRNGDALERQVATVELIESESPFLMQALSDTSLVATAALPQVFDTLAKQRVEQIIQAQEEHDRKYQRALIELEQVQDLALLEFEQEERVARGAFEQEHRFSELKQEYEELLSAVREVDALIGDSTRSFLGEKVQVMKLLEEWRRHEPVFPGTEEVNPIYLDLGHKLADQRLSYETAQALEAAAKGQAEPIAQRMVEIGEAYHALAPVYAAFALERALKRADFEHRALRVKAEFERDMEDRATDLEKNLEYWQNKNDLAYQADWERYISSMSEIVTLRPLVERLESEVSALEKMAAQTQGQLKALQDSLALLIVQRERLGRNRQVQQESFGRFAKLVEETRIAREKAAGDIQLLTRAIEPRRLPETIGERKTLIGGGVGFLLSTILALLVEYMHQARLRRRSGAEAD